MKSRVPDAILFYRLGDFYEMFFDDATEAAPLLGIALTRAPPGLRHRGADVRRAVPERRPPHRPPGRGGPQGRVCDQVEEARAAKGLVRRDITRVVTPGTVLDPESAPARRSLVPRGAPSRPSRSGARRSSTSRPGGSTPGTFRRGRVPDALALFRPREILLPEGAEALPACRRRRPRRARLRGGRRVPGRAPRAGTLRRARRAAAAARRSPTPGSCGRAASTTSARRAPRVRRAHGPRRLGDRDAGALRVLRRDARERSLFALLDRTRTPLGRPRPARGAGAARRSIRWSSRRAGMRSRSSWRAGRCSRGARRRRSIAVGDLERRFARVAVGTAGPRDVAALGCGPAGACPAVLAAAARLSGGPAARPLRRRARHGGLRRRGSSATLAPEPPVLASAGGVIREGADAELDALRALRRDAQGALLAIEAEERHAVGHLDPEGPLQPRLRLLARGRRRAPREGPGRLDPPAVARQRRALRHARPEGARGEDPRRGGPHRRDRGAALSASCSTELSARRRPRGADGRGVAELDARRLAWRRSRAPDAGRARSLSATPALCASSAGRHPLVERLRREEPFMPNDTRPRRANGASSS